MKRRKLLKILGSVAGGAILVPSGLYLTTPGIKYFAEKIIYRHLGYLKLDPGGVSQYVEDYFKGMPDSFTNTIRWKSYYYLNIKTKDSINIYQLIRCYLLSSDFFQYKMDTKRTIKYAGLYDPYKSPVANPFSYIYLPDKSNI
ncbi:MAG TPA: hypothetical protein PKE30_12265 [Niabella sp.]|nr:hypothetical protein [Niabella sp.]